MLVLPTCMECRVHDPSMINSSHARAPLCEPFFHGTEPKRMPSYCWHMTRTRAPSARALQLVQKETRLEEDSYRKASHSYMNKLEADAVHVSWRRVSYNWHKSERRGDYTCEVCDQCGEAVRTQGLDCRGDKRPQDLQES